MLFIEELDKIIKEDKKRKEKVVKKNDNKTIITLLGTIEYERHITNQRKMGDIQKNGIYKPWILACIRTAH